jgi:hypothetical protein
LKKKKKAANNFSLARPDIYKISQEREAENQMGDYDSQEQYNY